MKQIPILFTTSNVQSIQADLKNMTRRIVKPQPIAEKFSAIIGGYDNIPLMARFWTKREPNNPLIEDIKIKYQVGNVLWVRETWKFNELDKKGFRYKADYFKPELNIVKWKPSIFMPKSAARIFLEITDLRVERLEDITKEDAIAEGIETWVEDWCKVRRYRDYVSGGGFWENDHEKVAGLRDKNGVHPAIASYRSLWAKINGFDSLNSNPWVFVITFKKLKT